MKRVWRSGRVVECNPIGRGIESRDAAFDDSFVGKLTENCRQTPSRENKKRREIPMVSKYSVLFVETRRINAIFMSKKFSVPLTSESVTSGQAGGVFRQLFLQCISTVKLFQFHPKEKIQRILIYIRTVCTLQCTMYIAPLQFLLMQWKFICVAELLLSTYTIVLTTDNPFSVLPPWDYA